MAFGKHSLAVLLCLLASNAFAIDPASKDGGELNIAPAPAAPAQAPVEDVPFPTEPPAAAAKSSAAAPTEIKGANPASPSAASASPEQNRNPATAQKPPEMVTTTQSAPAVQPITPPPIFPEASAAGKVAEPLPQPKKTMLTEFAGPDIAIILARNQFYPSSIRVKSGSTTRLIFTTVNRKPGALILERLQIQKWIPGASATSPITEVERAQQEVTREISAQKITEILIEPKPGSYSFYDALTGATGEITVE